MVEVGPTVRLWAVQDANWNVVALVNSSGSVVERYDYTPFGQVTIMNASGTVLSSSAYSWSYTFQGGRTDEVTGDDWLGARIYDPVLERWTTIDPIGLLAGDPDMYRFVGNGPTDRIDPSGLEEQEPLGLFRWIAGLAPERLAGPAIVPEPGIGARIVPVRGPILQAQSDLTQGKPWSFAGHCLEASVDAVGVGALLNKGRQIVTKCPQLANKALIAFTRTRLAQTDARIAQMVEKIDGLQTARGALGGMPGAFPNFLQEVELRALQQELSALRLEAQQLGDFLTGLMLGG